MKRIIIGFLVLSMLLTMAMPFSATAASSSRVDDIMANMTLCQKVTQMLMVDFRYWDEDLTDSVARTGFTVMNSQVREIVENYDFGAIIYFAQNLVSTEQAYDLTMEMQLAATKDGGIPMIISADQEGGSVYRLATGTALPGNMALGAATDAEYSKSAGEIIGSELSALGINTTLAPVVDVNNNPNNPVIGLRSYSDNATVVGNLASATINGLKTHNVIGCAKHFPGHGDTAVDSHYGLPSVDKSLAVLKECELKPYEIAIDQGVDMIMTAHILYPQLEKDKIVSQKTGVAESLPATMSDDIITKLLKDNMGFSGIVVTDAMNMAGIAEKWNQVQSVVVAINAGVDMICMPCTLYDKEDLADLDAIINGVVAAVNNNQIPMSRINDAVKRILTVKENNGILDWSASNYSKNIANTIVGSNINRQSEREMSAAAVTVTQNKNNTLPLNITAQSKVLFLCPYNNERAQLLMGWNRAKTAGLIPNGAECKVTRFNSATLSTYQSDIDWADTVFVLSEIGSLSKITSNHWLYSGPVNFVTYAESKNKTTIVMSVDKPYDVQCYENADAILAVYGCKGSSVDPTEALVGGVTSSEAAFGPNIVAGVEVALGTFAAKGKLPLDIPKASESAFTSTKVYSRGTGITFNAKHTHKLSLVKACNSLENSYGYTTDFYECSGCGMWFMDNEGKEYIADKFSIVITPDFHTHVYGDYSFNDAYHWKHCISVLCDDREGSITEISAHFGGIATETEKAKCQACNTPYGDLETPDENHVLGDVNKSGAIDMMDYILLKRNYFGTFVFDADQLKCGDVNHFGAIDMMDYILLKRAYFGTFKLQ